MTNYTLVSCSDIFTTDAGMNRWIVRRGVPFDEAPEVCGVNVLHLRYVKVAASSLKLELKLNFRNLVFAKILARVLKCFTFYASTYFIFLEICWQIPISIHCRVRKKEGFLQRVSRK